MFFKKAKGPKNGDFVSYVEELQKKHSQVSLDADSAKEAMSHPLEHCVDKIKADHENTMNKIREENLFKNSTSYNEQTDIEEQTDISEEDNLHPKDIPLDKGSSSGLYESPEGPVQWPKKTQTKSRNFNKKSSIPLIICFFMSCISLLKRRETQFVVLPISIVTIGTAVLLFFGHGEARFHIPFMPFIIMSVATWLSIRIKPKYNNNEEKISICHKQCP